MKFRTHLLFKETHYVRDFIFQKSGIRLKDYYVEQLLTRSSFPYHSRSESNEVFELYGDSILSYITIKKMYEHYGMLRTPLNSECDDPIVHILVSHERNYTDLKNQIVSNEALANIIDAWAAEGFNILDYMLVGQCDIANRVDKVGKIKADVFEAIIGAIAVQTQFNPKSLEEAVSNMIPFETIFIEYDKAHSCKLDGLNIDNAISQLDKMEKQGYCSRLQYDGNETISTISLPWYKSLRIDSWGINLLVYSKSKPEAKKAAAYLALIKRFEQANAYGPNSNVSVWTYADGRLTPGI